jgi:alkylation response protein AidB-like acyl-CoA dehydrogenase
MKFSRSAEQQDFAHALDALLGNPGTVSAARAWARSDTDSGTALWLKVADIGVTGLLTSEDVGGVDGSAPDMAVAFDRLGYHGVPGPWIESAVVVPILLANSEESELLSELSEGKQRATITEPEATRALDAHVAARTFVLTGDRLLEGTPGKRLQSIDPARTLFTVEPGNQIAVLDPAITRKAYDSAALACASMLVGAGDRLLDDTVAYVGQRQQFNRVIGSYQAVKHALADVKVALDFARPLIIGAAHELAAESSVASRDVSAAKVAANNASYRAARAALQLHGAVGYTLELDLSLWILRVQALVSVWGTTTLHRNRIAAALTEGN